MKVSQTETKIFALVFLLFSYSLVTKAQSIYELQAGTKIRVQMDNEINSKVSSVNDTFTTTVTEPVVVRDVQILPVGTIIEGRVTKVSHASAGGKNGKMDVVFETLRFVNGGQRRIEGVLVNKLVAESSQKTSILAIIGGAALGAVIGALSEAGNGAIFGTGIGGGAGTAVALLRKGKDVKIKSDEKFEIEIKKNVTLPVKDF